jgi:ParB family chromosome partitioning protein
MKSTIVPMAQRNYQMIPVEKITVLNSRSREEQQFAENVRSIEEIGLLKPIVVNARNFQKTGSYELICGEGRLIAHQQLKKPTIAAEVVDCDLKTALLYSLVENIARVPPGTMWFAREMKRMHDAGFSFTKIASIVGKNKGYVSHYIQLVNQGENRLIEGVERGLFSISFAVQVAQSDSATIQNILMDAFDAGFIDCITVPRIRKLLELRLNRGKTTPKRNTTSTKTNNIKILTREIAKATTETEGFVRETTRKENRLFALLLGTSTLLADAQFLALLKTFNLSEPPQLSSKYGIGDSAHINYNLQLDTPENKS